MVEQVKGKHQQRNPYNRMHAMYSDINRFVESNIQQTFLPYDFPKSVGPFYLDSVLWRGISNLTSTANAVMASTFMLYAVGLGASAGIPTSGALNWVLKDGLGQIGTLLLGRILASRLDLNPKSWYLVSTFTFHIALSIEIQTILFPSYFLFLGVLSNTLKGLSWMIAGSTRTYFNVSFEKGGNIADITAKATSQAIFTSTIGTLAGAGLCYFVQQSPVSGFTTFAVLTVLCMATSHLYLKSIPLKTLNQTRLQLLVTDFLNLEMARQKNDHSMVPGIWNPQELSMVEPTIHFPGIWTSRMFPYTVSVGTPIEQLVYQQGNVKVLSFDKFIVVQNYDSQGAKWKPHLLLREDATQEDILRGFLYIGLLKLNNDDFHKYETWFQRFKNQLTLKGWILEYVKVEDVKRRYKGLCLKNIAYSHATILQQTSTSKSTKSTGSLAVYDSHLPILNLPTRIDT